MLHVIPTPANLKAEGEGRFRFERLVYTVTPVSQNALVDFVQFCKQLPILVSMGEQANLIFSKTDLPAEAYRIVVNETICVEYGGKAGALYALQTIKQLLLQQGDKGLPYLEVEDTPRYQYRGFMLDVGRYFYPVSDIKKFLDRMALHKLNVFHFHLTEDQGWRVAIKKYPLLTQKGSRRGHTNFGVLPHGGFYTQDQIKEIVAYAHSLCIKVIPEFDVPGHTMSAIACYPELGCFHRKLKVKTHWGVKHDILCAGKESTYRFVYDVLDELMELFPDKVIHLGGDEAVKMRWDICPDCKKAMQEKGLKDSEELQQVFMSKVSGYLKEHGYASMMWNWDSIQPTEHLDPGIAWNLCGADQGHQQSNLAEMEKGRLLINTSSFPYYLDLPYGWIDLRRAANFDPDAFLHHPNMIGVEAPLWTEYVPNMRKADYMTYPRLGTVATAAWSPPEARGYDRFQVALPHYYRLLDCYNIHYATLRQANPSPLRARCGGLWFNRRQLHWEGLHNLIEDTLVKRKFG